MHGGRVCEKCGAPMLDYGNRWVCPERTCTNWARKSGDPYPHVPTPPSPEGESE